MLEDKTKPAWAGNFFSGVPAPAGAGLAMAPFYLGFLDLFSDGHDFARLFAPYVVAIAVLMVSPVPTFSGKNITRVPQPLVLPILAAGSLAVVFLISFPWETLTVAAAAYLALIPLGIRSWLKHKKGPAPE
jgi:CDP-diacylglycerol---serine O-phosphatidyltransferase